MPSSGVHGIITAPSLMQARIVSQSSTWLPSMSTTRSPRATPRPRSQVATWLDRRDICAHETFCSEPSCSTIHSAGSSARSPAATWSNQSSPKLNCSNRGQANSALAVG